jgi:hypothetical protein
LRGVERAVRHVENTALKAGAEPVVALLAFRQVLDVVEHQPDLVDRGNACLVGSSDDAGLLR